MMCFPNMCLPQSTPELSFTLDTFDTKFLSLYILYLFLYIPIFSQKYIRKWDLFCQMCQKCWKQGGFI